MENEENQNQLEEGETLIKEEVAEETFDEIDEVESQLEEKEVLPTQEEKELQELKKYLEKVKELVKNNPRLVNRVENKFDLVAEIVNASSNQKLANLDYFEINQLLKRREFYNYLLVHSPFWNVLANLVLKNIQDIENYSLSKDAALLKYSLIEHVKQYSLSKNLEARRRMFQQEEEIENV